MTDDLVKRLRADEGDWLTDQAADRIEQLQSSNEALERERDEWKSLAEAAIKDDASKNIYYAEVQARLA